MKAKSKGFKPASTRDWFAGMALSGLATNQETLFANQELMNHFGTDGIDRLQADKAYRLADAMMERRKKPACKKAKSE